jgi:hypothetical protein
MLTISEMSTPFSINNMLGFAKRDAYLAAAISPAATHNLRSSPQSTRRPREAEEEDEEEKADDDDEAPKTVMPGGKRDQNARLKVANEAFLKAEREAIANQCAMADRLFGTKPSYETLTKLDKKNSWNRRTPTEDSASTSFTRSMP